MNPENRIDRQASEMFHAYGKEKSIEMCSQYINELREDVNRLPFYQSKTIDWYTESIMFWSAVQSKINKLT